jgi:hypothetical protein
MKYKVKGIEIDDNDYLNDLDKIQGIDIVQQIESTLVKEISDSIDKQIIQNLFNSFPPRNEKRRNSIERIFR